MHVWAAETGLDRFPFPLSLISSVRWDDEHAALNRELQTEYPVGGDRDLTEALRIAAAPDTTVTMFGTLENPVRAYGAIVKGASVTVVQFPGPDPDFGGNVAVQIGTQQLVPKVFAAVIGELPAGRRPPLRESVDRLCVGYEKWTGAEATANNMRWLLADPRTGSGHFEARYALRTNRPSGPVHLNWIDVQGDGRYLYRHRHNDFHIDPVSHEALQHELTNLTEASPR